MSVRTEDLLKVRDGEPIDAALRERIGADPAHRREIRRLERVRERLRALPDEAPPSEAWTRIAAAARPPYGYRRRGRAAGFAAAVAAAAAAAWVYIGVLDAPPRGSSAPPSQLANSRDELQLPLAADRPAAPTRPPAYAALIEESARLEQLLMRLHPRPRRMNAATAITIADLEDRVAVLDEQLSFAAAAGVDERQRRALWRERVDVMNALVQVRYAQLQPVGRR